MKKIITFKFTNKYGQLKTVKFPMDSKFYNDLFDPSISEEQRNEVLLYEYRQYCADQKYARKHTTFAEDEEGNVLEPASNEPTIVDRLIKEDEYQRQHKMLMSILSKLSKKQSKVLILIYIDNKSQNDAAEEMNIKKAAFSRLLKRAQEELEKLVGKKIF